MLINHLNLDFIKGWNALDDRKQLQTSGAINSGSRNHQSITGTSQLGWYLAGRCKASLEWNRVGQTARDTLFGYFTMCSSHTFILKSNLPHSVNPYFKSVKIKPDFCPHVKLIFKTWSTYFEYPNLSRLRSNDTHGTRSSCGYGEIFNPGRWLCQPGILTAWLWRTRPCLNWRSPIGHSADLESAKPVIWFLPQAQRKPTTLPSKALRLGIKIRASISLPR